MAPVSPPVQALLMSWLMIRYLTWGADLPEITKFFFASYAYLAPVPLLCAAAAVYIARKADYPDGERKTGLSVATVLLVSVFIGVFVPGVGRVFSQSYHGLLAFLLLLCAATAFYLTKRAGHSDGGQRIDIGVSVAILVLANVLVSLYVFAAYAPTVKLCGCM